MFIKQLSYLVTLAKERHFGRAAEACRVSQPALSGAIRNIEQELGVLIVQRGRRFEGFTPEGERVLAWARRVLADCESLRQEATVARDDPIGTLRMGAIPNTLPIVPLLTDSCLRRFPHMQHEVYTLTATEILRRLGDFELDIGLSYFDDGRLSGFKAVPLFRERYVLIARDAAQFEERESVAWEEAARLPLCLLTRNMRSRRSIDTAFEHAGARINLRLETDSIMALYAHVRCAELFSVVPHSMLCLFEMRQEVSAIPLVPELSHDIGLLYPDRDPCPPLLDVAMDCFKSLDLQARFDAFLRH